jgi:hypothetical protein
VSLTAAPVMLVIPHGAGIETSGYRGRLR